MGYIGEKDDLIRRVYEDPYAEPAPVPEAVPEPAQPEPVPA